MRSDKFTVDRFDEGFAVLLQRDNETIEKVVPKALLGATTAEGDILLVTFNHAGEVVKSEILTEETEQARRQASRLLSKLQNKPL
ncbi:MAG: DUF3006 domain-containing protein [Bacillus sp. (in: firmicutes)]